jgi:hypothetical protein
LDVIFLKLFFIIFAPINVLDSSLNIGHILPWQWLCVAILTWVWPTPRIGNKMSILCLSQNERKLKVWNQVNCKPRKGPRCEVNAYIYICVCVHEVEVCDNKREAFWKSQVQFPLWGIDNQKSWGCLRSLNQSLGASNFVKMPNWFPS